MIQLSTIEIRGHSSAGPFSGLLTLSPGLQVISARNSYGKSLAARAVAWCLGLEPLFGVPDNDPTFFPLAAREEIDFEGSPPASILSSECSISLIHSDLRQLRLSRDIRGDPTIVRIEEREINGETRRSKLQARLKTMQDEHGGLQHFLFNWLRWPRAQVATFKGTVVEVYLENLAPLFYIEQDEGWTDLQARQISRYAQIQIAQVAVEYLLGATDAVTARLGQQSAILRAAELRERARTISERVNSVFTRHGWSIDWSGNGAVGDILARWSLRSLREALKHDADFDFAARRTLLTRRAENLRRALTSAPLDPSDLSVHSAASQRVIELKRRRHELNDELRTLRNQSEQTEELLSSLEHRIHSATDVLRLKTIGVGRLEQVECPTCHREIDPSTFALTDQSNQSVTAHIEALKRDRNLINQNLKATGERLAAIRAETGRVESDFRDAERALLTVTEAVGTVREQLAQTATNLSEAEREIDRLVDTSAELDELQKIVDRWISDARAIQHPIVADSDLQHRLDAFTEELRYYLIALGHNAVTDQNATSLRLDDQYVPFLGSRRLKALGSASDRSRLVGAYSLALAAASQKIGGLHPGLVILDEPLQHNPDDPHRDLFSEFLGKRSTLDTNFQIVVFTFLRPTEINSLRQQGTSVVVPEGEHFLKLEAESGSSSISTVP